MILMISYDLNASERPSAYEAVKDLIEQKAISWRRPLFSQWFVETDEGAEQWHQALKAVVDDDDRWFICTVRRPFQGQLAKSVVDWLRHHVEM